MDFTSKLARTSHLDFTLQLARSASMGFTPSLARTAEVDFTAWVARTLPLGFTCRVARAGDVDFTAILAHQPLHQLIHLVVQHGGGVLNATASGHDLLEPLEYVPRQNVGDKIRRAF